MIETTLKAILGITLVLSGWLSVQMAWHRVFANSIVGKERGFNCRGCHGNCWKACDEEAADNEDLADQAQFHGQSAHQEV